MRIWVLLLTAGLEPPSFASIACQWPRSIVVPTLLTTSFDQILRFASFESCEQSSCVFRLDLVKKFIWWGKQLRAAVLLRSILSRMFNRWGFLLQDCHSEEAAFLRSEPDLWGRRKREVWCLQFRPISTESNSFRSVLCETVKVVASSL